MFASTLNGITATVRCVSSMMVVLNAKLTWLIAAQVIKKGSEKRRSPTRVPFLLVEKHKHLTSIAVLTVHAKKSLLYTFQRSMQANKNINLWYEKAPIYKLSRRKAPKTQQVFHYKHTRKTSGLFHCSTRASILVSTIIWLTQVPLQKFPFLFLIIIPWTK